MVVVSLFQETSVTIEALYALSNAAYKMWSDHGLDEPWMHRSIGEFQEALSDAMVFVALDAGSHELLGMHCFRGNLHKKRARGLYLAVSPKAFNQGVATQLLAYASEYLLHAGFTHLIGSTATGASWSVRWHLKVGYRLIGFRRAKSGCLDSYVFRKQLLRHPLYSSQLFCRCLFCYRRIMAAL